MKSEVERDLHDSYAVNRAKFEGLQGGVLRAQAAGVEPANATFGGWCQAFRRRLHNKESDQLYI
jgi:hypothetical protein